MPIPQNITKEHLLKAIDKIDKEGYDFHAESAYYDLVYNGKRYPPKLVVSWANIFANGIELDRNSFEGGSGTPAFKLLEENGFVILKKDSENKVSFFPQLLKFIEQSKGSDLKTADYLREYDGLKVKVSFGQGNRNRVPWMSFLGNGQTTSRGIYPVYLIYESVGKLILAYGISEKNPPDRDWNVKAPTIENYFESQNIDVDERYLDSYVFKAYDLNQPLDETVINSDLHELIQIYKSILQKQPTQRQIFVPQKTFDYRNFSRQLIESNIWVNQNLNLRFVASLLTKPFVILTGLSGSGKTKLAQAFAMWICDDESQYCIVPVGADWTNREPLLGFPNALEDEKYVKPENGVLDLIIKADRNQDKPYFLILDEMNLSHVERYFADFLSVMESKTKIALHSGNKDWNGIPSQIGFPKNLFIIGTVNIDETTYMFSPKVLDRASVIEFRVTASEMTDYLRRNFEINLENLEGMGKDMAVSFLELTKDTPAESNGTDDLSKTLMNFFVELKKTGAEFGYRSASEILRFAAMASKLDVNLSLSEITDAAIMQKLLPKVHGSRRKLEPILKTLGALCLNDGSSFEDYLSKKDNLMVKYPISLEKIVRMHDNLLSNGFTSYAEA